MQNQMKVTEQIQGKQKCEEEQQKFEFYLPLNNLWQRYMADLIQK